MASITEMAYEAILAENAGLKAEMEILKQVKKAEAARKRADAKSRRTATKAAKKLKEKQTAARKKKAKQRSSLKKRLGVSEYKARTKLNRRDERARASIRKATRALAEAPPVTPEEERDALLGSLGL